MLAQTALVVLVACSAAWVGPVPSATGSMLPLAGRLRAVPPAPTLVGPPTLCFPIEIGQERSLPWRGPGAFDVDPHYDAHDVVHDAYEILRNSDDVLVHMETIRRAVVYLSGIGFDERRATTSWQVQELGRLALALKAEIADRMVETPKQHDVVRWRALAWFDAGYLLAAAKQAGPISKMDDGAQFLAQAAERLPDDGAVRLGAAVALYDRGSKERTCFVHLSRALALAGDPSGLLRANLMGTFGRFLGTRTYDELVAAVEQQIERA